MAPQKHHTKFAIFLTLSAPALAGAQQTAPSTASRESTPHELEGVVVEGKLVEAPASAPSTTTAISEEELETFEEDDVHQVLLKVPGVQVRGEDGVGLRPNIGIRGTSPNRSSKITLMEDGVPLTPAPYSAPAAYYFPLVTRMSAVEVHKGGSQMRFGPRALGGAINLITAKIPTGWGAQGDVALGEYGYLKAHGRAGFGGENTGYLLEGAHIESTGFKDLDAGGDTGFSKNEMMAKWRLSSDPNTDIFHQLDVKLGFASERSNETYLGLTDEDFERTPYRRYAASAQDQMNWQRGQAHLQYTVFPTDNLELSLSAYRHQFSRDWFKLDGFGGARLDDVLRNPNSGSGRFYYDLLTGSEESISPEEELIMADNYRWYISQGVALGGVTTFSTGPLRHELEGGVRFHYDEVNRQHTLHRYNMRRESPGALALPVRSDAPNRRAAQNRGTSHALSFHLVDTLNAGAWTLTPGARVEVIGTKFVDSLNSELDNEETQVGVIPGAGFHYAITEDLGALAGIYRGFGPIAPQARSDEAPKAETSTTYEAGARYSTSLLHLEAIGFFNNYANLTANCSQAQGCETTNVGTQFNGGRVFVWGLESLLALEPSWRKIHFPIRATYGLTQSSFRSNFLSTNPAWGGVERGDELPYLPTHQFSFSAGVAEQDLFAVTASTTVVGAAREVAGSGTPEASEKTDAFALLGLTARGRAYGPVWIYAKVTNLLNTAYLTSRRPHGARPGAPRWVQMGIKIEH